MLGNININIIQYNSNINVLYPRQLQYEKPFKIKVSFIGLIAFPNDLQFWICFWKLSLVCVV